MRLLNDETGFLVWFSQSYYFIKGISREVTQWQNVTSNLLGGKKKTNDRIR